MRILVVEEEATLRDQLVQAIAAAGHTVEAASDGAQAHYLGEVEDFDAVVLDLGLPVLDGLSVLRRWRAQHDRIAVPRPDQGFGPGGGATIGVGAKRRIVGHGPWLAIARALSRPDQRPTRPGRSRRNSDSRAAEPRRP